MKKIVILHNEIVGDAADELDVLTQRDLVNEACLKLGHETAILTLGNDLNRDLKAVSDKKPDIVFNLVESLWGKGELIYLAPAILNAYKILYTGVPLDALFITTGKVLAKKMMRLNSLPTADFFTIDEINKLNPKKKYIAKPIWEEASVGISDDYIFTPSEMGKVEKIRTLPSSHYFIEEFIDGREFNVSILAGETAPEILPPAEIVFSDYFNDKPKIVGYKAKWDETSDEYKETNRSFGTLETNKELKDRLVEICQKSWEVFNLHGYARVDLRVDKEENVFILEINGNPCISPDSGFVAALKEAGYSTESMVERILKDLN
ncbi:MAG: ATP-grasp domain-containing protein [Nitrospinota bacterium]|nr:ATP-grasp domain-containing protein [Nitrospinota bacterium]